jgi:DNA ligase 1
MMRKKPMLAYPAGDKPIDYSKPIFIQPKLDGVRCVIQRESDFPGQEYLASFSVKAYSRTGKEWKNIDHILAELRPFFFKYPKVILDGELYNHDLKNDFEKIISLVRKTKPTEEDRLESAQMVQFHCYDIIDEALPFNQRMEFVSQFLMLFGSSIHVVDTIRVLDEEEAQSIHKRVILRKATKVLLLELMILMHASVLTTLESLKTFTIPKLQLQVGLKARANVSVLSASS